ncbi:hypothetical protein PCL_01269 [Purpureocillium lilacinum]|uniref:G-patch domain-containing protein n=1 Tax=Purpureocillium lilacinum TaxID=33203 RepID=A0A2U3E335_PURLI|nr:hypothetical protein PCL_01269 [Purpureocillium lilacinum]
MRFGGRSAWGLDVGVVVTRRLLRLHRGRCWLRKGEPPRHLPAPPRMDGINEMACMRATNPSAKSGHSLGMKRHNLLRGRIRTPIVVVAPCAPCAHARSTHTCFDAANIPPSLAKPLQARFTPLPHSALAPGRFAPGLSWQASCVTPFRPGLLARDTGRELSGTRSDFALRNSPWCEIPIFSRANDRPLQAAAAPSGSHTTPTCASQTLWTKEASVVRASDPPVPVPSRESLSGQTRPGQGSTITTAARIHDAAHRETGQRCPDYVELMSYKRSRSTFETDSNHAPYALFGTPLPDEADSRDDGAYLPLWKQEVRDERGRKRLHGAFTGGWSAGYFNTVGSKEGWTPSTFVSSRSSRNKDGTASKQQRAEDFMDEEDLADAAESQQIQTSQAFAGLGSTSQGEDRPGGLMGLFKTEGNTMGLQLLRRMGWKDGQGVGPKVRRSARLDVGKPSSGDQAETHLFAPDNAPMIQFVRKTDRMGLGHQRQSKLQALGQRRDAIDEEDEDNDKPDDGARHSLFEAKRPTTKPARGAFGIGVLNDTGSDDEDPYDIGPKIKYNRVIGGDKKKKKKASALANPSLDKAPKFVPRMARAGDSLRRCHDGRLPLPGYVLAKVTEDLASLFSEYAPPAVPPDWKSAKDPTATSSSSDYLSAADAAKASSLGPRERAALLGEKALPGKSVFDFISATARDKLAAASGKSNLPPARGEIPAELAMSEEEKRKALWDRAPKLERDTAAAALARSAGGPYADDEAKRTRYRRYLENQANPGLPPPEKRNGVSDDDFLREVNEFYNCARIFKPMTGFMASRFTTSKTVLNSTSAAEDKTELLAKPGPKVADPAEEAARVGMFGHMTRTVADFYPTRLLCKRFNVKAPAHSRPDNEPESNRPRNNAESWPMPAQAEGESRTAAPPVPVGALPALPAPGQNESAAAGAHAKQNKVTEVDPERNEALEGKAANEDVLRAIFGDADSDSRPEVGSASAAAPGGNTPGLPPPVAALVRLPCIAFDCGFTLRVLLSRAFTMTDKEHLAARHGGSHRSLHRDVRSRQGATTFPSLIDATCEDLSNGLERRLFTSVELVKASSIPTYLARIEQVNDKVHCVTEINPDALEIAAELDRERAAGNIRGQVACPRAGSWILYGAKVPRDAGVVTRLRAAGVVILGKTNMCQWAGYRCKKPSSGWSAHGGQTFAPYYESQEPCGSSGGSAVAVDLGLAFAALGTETDGSVVWPAQRSGVVGIKPTVGMTSRDMVVPISERMDSVGTIARTVRDAAYALQAITGPDPNDGYTSLVPTIPDLVAACKEDALRGSRIGVPWNVIKGQNEDKRWDVEIDGFRKALEVLEKNGATIIEVEFSAKMEELREVEYTVMGADFMSSLARYFADLSVNPSGVGTLAELRDLTQKHPKEGFPEKNTAHWDDVLAQGWDNSDARFAPACKRLLELGGPQGLLGALDRHDLTAVAMPTTLAAEWTAVVGAPMVTVPMGHYPAGAEVVRLEDGIVDTAPGVPYGLSFLGRLCSDADLVGLAYAFERETTVRERQTVRRWVMADEEAEQAAGEEGGGGVSATGPPPACRLPVAAAHLCGAVVVSSAALESCSLRYLGSRFHWVSAPQPTWGGLHSPAAQLDRPGPQLQLRCPARLGNQSRRLGGRLALGHTSTAESLGPPPYRDQLLVSVHHVHPPPKPSNVHRPIAAAVVVVVVVVAHVASLIQHRSPTRSRSRPHTLAHLLYRATATAPRHLTAFTESGRPFRSAALPPSSPSDQIPHPRLPRRTAAPETREPPAALSGTQEASASPRPEQQQQQQRIESLRHRRRDISDCCGHDVDADHEREQSPPPQYPASEASSSSRPPPFSSLFAPFHDAAAASSSAAATKFAASASAEASASAPAYSYAATACPDSEPFDPDQAVARAFRDPVAETKSVLPRDTKGESSRKDDDAEPPPAYSEGDSPLHSFSFVMSAAGGAASIITQVQQGGPPINAIGDVGADETIAMDLRGTRFVLSRDELLTLPEFVLLSLFPNGLFPEGHMNGFSENDAVQVDYDPASLQYMLDFFRNVAQSIPSESSPSTSQDGDAMDSLGSRDDSAKRAGIIVLREDLDFYAIPPSADISQPDMIEVKRAAAKALQQQDGIFSGLKRSDEPGTTEAHLIEMLTAGGFNHDDRWGHRAGEPNKAVICSLALARLRSDIRGNDMGTSAVGMAQKLLLFWRKPARRCWWEGIELDNIAGVEGKLKVWIRRVWTLEMSVIGLR